jgi:hypothetical protein
MRLRKSITLPTRLHGDDLNEQHQSGGRRDTMDSSDRVNYEPTLASSESEVEDPNSSQRPKRKRGRPLGSRNTKKVQIQQNGHSEAQRQRTTITREVRKPKSDDEVNRTPRYSRREDYKPNLRRLGGILFDNDGNPQHGIGEILEARDLEVNRRKASHFIKFDENRVNDKRLSKSLGRKETRYEPRYPKQLDDSAHGRFPALPEDFATSLGCSPSDSIQFMEEMATSSEDELVRTEEEVSILCPCPCFSQLTIHY